MTRPLPTPVLPFEDVHAEALNKIRAAVGTLAIHIALTEGKALLRGYYLAGSIPNITLRAATRVLIREASQRSSLAELRTEFQHSSLAAQ